MPVQAIADRESCLCALSERYGGTTVRSTDPNTLASQSTSAAQPRSLDSHGMRIDAERRQGDVVLAHVSGEVDLLSAPELRQWVKQNVTAPSALVLDLDGVGFLGSAGLSVLAELSEQAAHDTLTWAIVATKRVVLRPLEATGLVAQMPVYENIDDAVQAVAGDK
ncbi:anti-anti-sigma factor [Saccharomonospora xinjiangensis XJ-54]|uniref:Anti-sigma factor antagonist n=1 Tax=Saccharomonospora xinjiangensis XJ-54 TaxID=882086 RepID=I0UYI1_9PSEU|nr:anti-anti-sigma factor [Saccharomonospora xinjiangensis XJ-54]